MAGERFPQLKSGASPLRKWTEYIRMATAQVPHGWVERLVPSREMEIITGLPERSLRRIGAKTFKRPGSEVEERYFPEPDNGLWQLFATIAGLNHYATRRKQGSSVGENSTRIDELKEENLKEKVLMQKLQREILLANLVDVNLLINLIGQFGAEFQQWTTEAINQHPNRFAKTGGEVDKCRQVYRPILAEVRAKIASWATRIEALRSEQSKKSDVEDKKKKAAKPAVEEDDEF